MASWSTLSSSLLCPLRFVLNLLVTLRIYCSRTLEVTTGEMIEASPQRISGDIRLVLKLHPATYSMRPFVSFVRRLVPRCLRGVVLTLEAIMLSFSGAASHHFVIRIPLLTTTEQPYFAQNVNGSRKSFRHTDYISAFAVFTFLCPVFRASFERYNIPTNPSVHPVLVLTLIHPSRT